MKVEQTSEQARSFSGKIKEIIGNYFNGNRSAFHDYVIDTFCDGDVGTGKYLASQIGADVDAVKDGSLTVGLPDTLIDSLKTAQQNPSKWFVYSGDVLTELTDGNVKKIEHALATGQDTVAFP